MKGPLYRHDGQGDLVLVGAVAQVPMTLDQGKARFEYVERWRERAAALPCGLANTAVAEVDACMTSLLEAIDAAEAFRAKWGEPLNPSRSRVA